MTRLALIVCCWLLLPTFVSASTPPTPLASCSVCPGTLSLWFGISHEQYWRSGSEGKVAAEYAKGNLAAREYMADHDGDWCLFGISLEESAVVIPRYSDIAIKLEGDACWLSSTDILVDAPGAGNSFWRARDGFLTFGPESRWTYAISPLTRQWRIYVRFPKGWCLTEKCDGDYGRKFRAKVEAIQLIEGGE